MKLRMQRRIAAQVLKCGVHRVWMDPARLGEVKEAITKRDVQSLIKDLAIQKRPMRAASGFRWRKRLAQRRKGRRPGPGSREGKRSARFPAKARWMQKVRVQRLFLKELKERGVIAPVLFRTLYLKIKGGFFRSKRHIKLYLEEHELVKK